MKKRLTFGLATLALSAGAAGLRMWQRMAAYEPDTGLVIPGHPATFCLVAWLVLGAVALLFLSRLCVREADLGSYLKAFALPHRALLAVYLLSGAALVGAGVLGLQPAQSEGARWWSQAAYHVCLVPGGLCMALVGWLNAQKRESEGRFAWPLLGPAVCACVWLVFYYQSRASDPVVMDYAFAILGVLCAGCACYTMAAFSFEKPQGAWCLWLCAMGLALLATLAADPRPDGAISLSALGYWLYLAVQMFCLLHRCEVPARLERWEPTGENESKDVEIEESEQ